MYLKNKLSLVNKIGGSIILLPMTKFDRDKIVNDQTETFFLVRLINDNNEFCITLSKQKYQETKTFSFELLENQIL